MRTSSGSLFLVPLLAVLALAPMSSAQGGPVPNGERADQPLEVAIIGASVSGGFVDGPMTGGSPDNRTVSLQAVLRGWLRDADCKSRVRTVADVMMFMSPEQKGESQVETSLKSDPSIVFAIDFLFWYGYGYMRGSGTEEELRLARLEKGLAQLDRFSCPVILGDLPDMKGAARRMISPQQIPDEAILDKLNARIRAWAKERPRMHVFGLRELVTVMKEEGVELPLEDGKFKVPPGKLLQGDRLHANRLGMAWLGYLLQDAAKQALGEQRAGDLPRWAIEDFVDLCKADLELEDLMAGAGK